MAASSKHGSTALAGSIVIAGVGWIQGVGAAIARRFGREGYPVVIAGRNTDKLVATCEALEAEDIRVTAVPGDVTQSEDVKRFIAAAEKLAPLAIAVHNAGSNRPAPFLQMPEEDFETHWREHALGAFNLARAALPALLARHPGVPFHHGARPSFN
jgi:NAD(P)-dependent dehydrogenase (short-subunit alcohol dehydrogenase family)